MNSSCEKLNTQMTLDFKQRLFILERHVLHEWNFLSDAYLHYQHALSRPLGNTVENLYTRLTQLCLSHNSYALNTKQVHGGQFSPIKRSSLTQFYHIFCQIGVIVKFAMQITFWGPNTIADNKVLSCLGILTWPSMKHGWVEIDPSFLIWSLSCRTTRLVLGPYEKGRLK